MESVITAYFSDDNNKRVLSNMVDKIGARIDKIRDSDDESYKFILEFIGTTLLHMVNHSDSFDERCIVNIASLGDVFVSDVKTFNLNVGDAEHLFGYCYRFLVEYQLSSPKQIPDELRHILSRVPDFEYGVAAGHLKYADHQMLISVVQHYIYHPSLVALKNLPDVIKLSEMERGKAEKAIGDREGRIQAQAEKLEKYETAFNFVGLYSGFKGLRDTKNSEKRLNFVFLLGLGVLLLVPLVAKFLSVMGILSTPAIDFFGLLVVAGLELLILYFFRVVLHNFRSIKAQLLQIDLRMTLCQFVQSYAEYSNTVPNRNGGLFERFEQVVFSGIVNDESAIPSTFDGIEKLSELVGSFRKG